MPRQPRRAVQSRFGDIEKPSQFNALAQNIHRFTPAGSGCGTIKAW
jgi:hypothetical protein